MANPELPALTDALKLKKLAEKFSTYNIGVVVNRVRGESNEYTIKDIENFLEAPVLGVIREDSNVRDSIAMKEPVVVSYPNSRAAQQMRAIAAKLIGKELPEVKIPLTERLFGWLK